MNRIELEEFYPEHHGIDCQCHRCMDMDFSMKREALFAFLWCAGIFAVCFMLNFL